MCHLTCGERVRWHAFSKGYSYMKNPTVDVIIPTYKPDPSFRTVLERLSDQYYAPSHILIINTDEKYWDAQLTEGIENAEVYQIRPEEFDHAATRDMGADLSDADVIVFMTQDAVPHDRRLIGNLIRPLTEDPLIKISYARQLPKPGCRIPEGCVRSFNYPHESHVRRLEDLKTYGIKTFFCSDVCAAYDRRTFHEIGGFAKPCIFNEDSIFAGKIITLGYAVAYAADARVLHSHNYTNMQQFHRNFDNGVSHAMHPEIFRSVASEGEGVKLVQYVTGSLRKMNRGYLIPGFYIQCFFRYAGFKLGEHYAHLPDWMVMACTGNRRFWTWRDTED